MREEEGTEALRHEVAVTVDLETTLRQHCAGAVAAVQSLDAQMDAIAAMCAAVRDVLLGGGTVYTAGNGGSAAHALHLAEELIGRYKSDRRPYRAIALTADPTALTCIANDFGYDEVFARQCEALLTDADALVVLSTSGNSPNLLKACQVARDRGTTTVGLLGKHGGICRALCDHAIVIESDHSAHVQEAHQVLVHMVCEGVE